MCVEHLPPNKNLKAKLNISHNSFSKREKTLEPLKEDHQTLIDLGLTLLQAKVYLALVQSGTLKVGTIAQVSKVARPDVYRTLQKLQDLGLIEKIITKPILFRATP